MRPVFAFALLPLLLHYFGTRWQPVSELAEHMAGHPLPKGYLGAIRQAIAQRPSV